MNNIRLFTIKSPKTWLQIGIFASALLPVSFFLLIGTFISKQLDSTMSMIMLLIIAMAIALIFLSTVTTTLFIQRRIDATFKEATTLCQAYTSGDRSIRMHMYGEDTFAQLMMSVNILLETVSEQQQADAQNNAVRPIEQYFEKKREKGSMALRVIERSTNTLVLPKEETKVAQIQHSALQLARAARNLIDRSAFQEQALRAQTIQIFQTTEKVESLAVFVRQISRNAQGASSLAYTGIKRLQKSQQTLHDILDGMNMLKEQTQKSAQKVYRAGEHSHMLNHVLQVIDSISSQLTLLSQHPVLQPVGTGDQDIELAEIAYQLQQLVTRTSDAAHQLIQLATTIEKDMHSAVVELQTNGRDVVQNLKQIEDAGQTLHDLYHSMEFQAGMIDDMVQAASEQAPVVDAAASAMTQVAKVAYQASKEMQQNVQGLKKLAQSSDQLQSVATSDSPALEASSSAPLLAQDIEGLHWDEASSRQSKA